MSHRKKQNNGVSRREFFKVTGTGAVIAGSGAGFSQIGNAQEAPEFESSSVLQHSTLVSRHTLETDVVIIGGGMSGVCAALAAARNGANVILVQDRSVLGGNASSEVRMHIVGADRHGNRKNTDSRESGIIEELRLEDSYWNLQRSASMWDVILYDWIIKNPNITLLLNSDCHGVVMGKDKNIQAAIVSRHSTEDLYFIRGKIFLDCTGDGRLGAEAGADFHMGREAQSEYGESMAPPEADPYLLGSSILFVTRQYDKPMPFKAPSFIRKFNSCDELPHRGHNSWEYGYWWVEWGGEHDIIKDNEMIRDELLAVALGVWDHIKNSGHHPTSENWALEWVGAIPGKRESRRFLGDHVLIEQELKAGEEFEDGVAFGGWNIDLHPPKGVYEPGSPYVTVPIPLYNIPYRSLYSRNIPNLLFAGRNISASHVAFGSTRVMATCSVIGQAAGTAAALCIRHCCLPRALSKDGIKELQQTLLKDDAYIIGATNSDPYDLALNADVRASSEIFTDPAFNIRNGVHRGVYGHSNRWRSDPNQELPQWIELRFKEPQKIKEVHIVFDTGLNRQLTLSQSDGTTRQMIRGPQPECVKDYDLQILSGESAKTIAEVEGNYQRKRIHTFDPATADGIRLNVKSTHGLKSASVFEIRVYS
jgi:hypothetical protein